MNPDLVREVETLRNEFDDRPKPEIFSAVIDQFLSTPGLVGFWPMSSVQRSTGNAYDLSGQGRTLTYNGNPTYNIYNDFVPYINLDGTGDYLSRADETDLDILGTEAIYASAVRGLTLGGWFRQVATGTQGLITKDDAGANRSYALRMNTDSPSMQINGDPAQAAISSVAVNLTEWNFLVGRYIPSTEVAIFVNKIKTTDTTGIGASINNTTAALNIGGFGGSFLYNGDASLCFLAANNLSDTYINGLFEQSRILFGV